MNKFADFIARNQYSHMIILAVLLLVILPLSMDIFRLNLVGVVAILMIRPQGLFTLKVRH